MRTFALRKSVRFIAGLYFLLLLAACTSSSKKSTYKVGFSQCGETDAWRRAMIAEMRRELAFHPEIELLYKEAQDNSQLQVKQIRELLDAGIDLLIVSPNEAEPLTPIVEEAFQKGLPVIVVDRKIASSSYNNYIGADNYALGKMAGEYASQLLKGKGNIIEITGLPTSSPALERARGFADAVSLIPGINITHTVSGDWVKPIAKKTLEKISTSLSATQLIFAHNDNMASGAYEVSRAAGYPGIKIIGVDALPGKGSGMEFVRERILTASMLYPTGGTESIRNAAKILSGQPVNKETILQTLVVDSGNVRMMQLQTDKINSQQEDIGRQQEMLAEQQKIYRSQRTYIFILGSILLLAIFFAGLLFYSRLLNRRINKQLVQRNEEVQRKTDELIDMSEKANAAHEAKLNFFTNISHEFRTPLSLILGPVEELQQTPKLSVYTKQSLDMIQRNARRLMKLVSELLEFRKIELNKVEVKASQTDLVLFTNELVQSFQSLARKRGIDCRLLTSERLLTVWIDESLFEKVINNLLSNAFKFTKEAGFIIVTIEKDNARNMAVIKVEDNGIGMTEEEMTHVFDPFFQGKESLPTGSGLGLALAKELVRLHHGDISVQSIKNKGTGFTVTIPLGKEHFLESELITDHRYHATSPEYNEFELDASENDQQASANDNNESSAEIQKTATILVIDDNAEMRSFLRRQLMKQYFVIEAENGITGLQQVFEQLPDLVITDVMMPGKDGLALADQLKKDIRTAHIPVVLLTAKTAIEQQIAGMKAKADAYITKPFNSMLLQQTIANILENRMTLKEHLAMEIPLKLQPTSGDKKSDRQFMLDFTAVVEQNISNADFSVDDIAKALHVSKIQLYRKVKALLQTNINEYILNARIQKAKRMLQEEQSTIAEIAFQTGFASASYFSTVFKQKTGSSPYAYKKGIE